MDDILTLIATSYTKNDYGVDVPVESCREVFAKVNSVTRAEFFDGGRNGLNPQLVFRVFRGDYCGEQTCEFHGLRYGIYRTFMTPDDYIELYAERKGGTNG